MTETNAITVSIGGKAYLDRPGSCGKPNHMWDLRILDDDGNVIKVPGAQYDEMGVRKLYQGQEENQLADEAAKKIAGAALDVFGEGSAPPPPLPEDSPLYGLDNVVLTPHIGWQRLEARQRVVDMCAENMAAFARGDPTNIDMDTGLPRVTAS